ncbi:sulfotransferase [Nocardioides sambongensis]|uniref:sulfotransferase n=1 Tax=Nocardioides sambongensis TaxID=2589074 RepID=UPI0015E86448|nr:sulfotransferase [Nocardioides sambongensis]
MQLIVAGFHRSGTSLVTQLLVEAGLFVGDELLGSRPSNPYGHFEDTEFLRLHRAILERHGSDWQWDAAFPHFIGPDHWRAMVALIRKRELAYSTWGFKDPRVCLFLGAWNYLLPDAKFLVVYRDPAECVRSLETRQADDLLHGRGNEADHRRFFSEPDHGLRLWDTYNRGLVNFVRTHRDDCLVINHQQVVDGYPVVRRVNERLGLSLADVSAAEVFDPAVTGRRSAPLRTISDDVADRVRETWETLESLTDTEEAV